MREPSPAGDIIIGPSADELTKADGLNLDSLMDQLKRLPAGGEVLVVTHSNPRGFKMKLAQGATVSAGITEMQTIMTTREGVRRRAAIGQMSPVLQANAWRQWFKDFDPGVILGAQFAIADAEKFADQWFLQTARNLGLPSPTVTLQHLLDQRDAVIGLGLKRIEFRACRLGNDANALKAVAAFFGTKQVLAPKEVRTFYGVISHVDLVPDYRVFLRSIASIGDPVAGGLHARKRGVPGRVFDDIVNGVVIRFEAAPFLGEVSINLVPAVGLEIGESNFRVIAIYDRHSRHFIDLNICPNYNGPLRPFIIGGFETTLTTASIDKRFVFPLETEYKTLIASASASQP